MNSTILFITLLVAGAFSLEKALYNNYQVHKVIPWTKDQVKCLRNLEKQFNFWTDASAVGKPVYIMVSSQQRALFDDAITNIGHLNSELYINNVQQLIDTEQRSTRALSFNFNNYYRLNEIYNYLDELAANHTKVKVITGGKSYEKRDIRGIHISNGKPNSSVFIEGGIHAREWIAPATVLYLATELIKNTDSRIRAVAEAHDWFFFPVFNPDGYEYSHTTDRLWRKTRKPYSLCGGADANRNWDFHWMENGGSNLPCSGTYAGDSPFSEPETKSMSEFISTIGKDLTHYFAFHSFGQFILIPYGYSNDHVDNYDQLYNLGIDAANALIQRYGTNYTVGNVVDILYPASGGSVDWVKGTIGTQITYTLELRDKGKYAFILPQEQIIPTGEETMDALLTIMEKTKNT